MKSFLSSLALVLPLLLFFSDPAWCAPLTPEMLQLKGGILAEKRPLRFAFIKEFNPYSAYGCFKKFEGEGHRVLLEFTPPEGSLESSILDYVNNPKNQKLLILRKTMTLLRRTLLAQKPASDPYARFLKAEDTVYFLISSMSGETGPMTQINVANLLLPETWAQRNCLEATREEGKIVYGYVLLANGLQRTTADLFNDRKLFEHFMVHLGLRLVEGEGRGQSRGLDAHFDAHTGPSINLGYGTTWCQNRGFYESFPLAERALLTQLFPEIFREPKLEELLERDRFLYFPKDPWSEDFPSQTAERAAWNTPQAVLRSHYLNALFLDRMWNEPEIHHPIRKSVELLGKKGAVNLREFFSDWWEAYPDDRATLSRVFLEVTHGLTIAPAGNTAGQPQPEKLQDYFRCLGPDLWISTSPKFNRTDQVNFNASSVNEMQVAFALLFSSLSERLKNSWLHSKGPDGQDRNLYFELAQAISKERGNRCGQFKDMGDLSKFIIHFAQENNLPALDWLPILWKIEKAKRLNKKVYEDQHRLLISIGAFHPEKK